MQRSTVLAAVALAALAAAGCADEQLGFGGLTEPPPPPSLPSYESQSPMTFQARDFAWSAHPGPASIFGAMAYHIGAAHYSCQGGDVLLTPETAWSRRRMVILYGSAISAAVPVSIVRARTPSAPSGDYARYVRKTTCDDSNHFSFENLPSGAWFVITIAKPMDGPGEDVAVTRRVETRGGPRSVTLY
jgi:hypothetical protein